MAENSGGFEIDTIPKVGFRFTALMDQHLAQAAITQSGTRIFPANRRWAVTGACFVALLTGFLALGPIGRSAPSEIATLPDKVGGSIFHFHPAMIPRTIAWQYEQGQDIDAPNGLRFWRSVDGVIWDEAFADGGVRSHFHFVSNFHLDKVACGGILLRRDNSLLAFVPDDQCPSRLLLAEDIEPYTGQVVRPWYVLGKIKSTAY